METHDETKLPKWAQSLIQVLRMRVEEADKRAAVREGKAETDTYIEGRDPITSLRLLKPLEPGTIIAFIVGGHEIRVHVKDGLLNVKLNVNASFGRLNVLPNGANDVDIAAERY